MNLDKWDRELYEHKRLPKPDNSDGPTAHYMAALADLAARVTAFPHRETTPVDSADESVAS